MKVWIHGIKRVRWKEIRGKREVSFSPSRAEIQSLRTNFWPNQIRETLFHLYWHVSLENPLEPANETEVCANALKKKSARDHACTSTWRMTLKNKCTCKKIPKWRQQKQWGLNTQQEEDNVRQTGIKQGVEGDGKSRTAEGEKQIPRWRGRWYKRTQWMGDFSPPGEQQRMNIPTLQWTELCAMWNYIVLIDGTWLACWFTAQRCLASHKKEQMTSEAMLSTCSRLLRNKRFRP